LSVVLRTKLQSLHPRGKSIWSNNKQIVSATVARVHPNPVFVFRNNLFVGHFA